eukprot:scaffold29997_cov171-Skeletonema_menzelii.AAC.3
MMDDISALPIEAKMTAILVTMFAILVGMHSLQKPANDVQKNNTSTKLLPLLLPDPKKEPSKYCYEVFAWYYTALWIGIFGFIVVSQAYEYLTAWGYLGVCGGLALPLMLQPLLYPLASAPVVKNKIIINPDIQRPFYKRYSTKATIYLMTYAFIGNYWYTHYFYSVLKAEYTMPSHRLNDVPIAMFLATHFYFCTYHVCVSNDDSKQKDRPVTLVDTLTIACGHGMMILLLLDFVRLYLGIPLVIGGVAFATTG